MVTLNDTDVADALHLSSVTELPDGYQQDIAAAETLMSDVEAEADADHQDLVDQAAIYVACAFIAGSERSGSVKSVERESVSITYDTDKTSMVSMDYWERAKRFDPTGLLSKKEVTDIGFKVV